MECKGCRTHSQTIQKLHKVHVELTRRISELENAVRKALNTDKVKPGDELLNVLLNIRTPIVVETKPQMKAKLPEPKGMSWNQLKEKWNNEDCNNNQPEGV